MTSIGSTFNQLIDDCGNVVSNVDDNGNVLKMPEIYEAKVIEENSVPPYLKTSIETKKIDPSEIPSEVVENP
jgi:hypothetical protein